MNPTTVRRELAARVGTIPRLQPHEYPPGSITPDAAIVQPQRAVYDLTYGRGSDRFEMGLIVATGKPHERSAHERLDEYAAGSGDRSIKAVLESGEYEGFDAIVVTAGDWDVVPIGGVNYLACLFTLDVVGDGRA